MTLRARIVTELEQRQAPNVWDLALSLDTPVAHVSRAVGDMRTAGMLGDGDPLRLVGQEADTDGDGIDEDCDDLDDATEDEPPEDAVQDDVIDLSGYDDADADADGDADAGENHIAAPQPADPPIKPELIGVEPPEPKPTATASTRTATATRRPVDDDRLEPGDDAFAAMLASMERGRSYKRGELDELAGHTVSSKTLLWRLRAAIASGHLIRRGRTTSTRYSLPDEKPTAPLDLAPTPKARKRNSPRRLQEVSALVKERGIVTIAEVRELTIRNNEFVSSD